MINTVLISDIKDTLMEPKGPNIKEPYFIIPSPDKLENITVLASGKNGLEFNKTGGFFSSYPGVINYRCLYGQGLMLIQRSDETGEAKEVRVVGLRPGTEVEVPSGYNHSVINTGKSFLVTVDNAPKEERFRKTEQLKEKRGLAYYIIDKKGEIAFEKNDNYRFHPQITNN